MKFFAVLLVGTLFAGLANTEEVDNFRMCQYTHCDVSDFYIDPCPEALEDKPCEIPRGINTSLNFKFILRFSAKRPRTRLYAITFIADIPFLDMNPNACLYTGCPLVANEEHNYNYILFVSPRYPLGAYTVKIKLWDSDSSIFNECCFEFDLKIVAA